VLEQGFSTCGSWSTSGLWRKVWRAKLGVTEIECVLSIVCSNQCFSTFFVPRPVI